MFFDFSNFKYRKFLDPFFKYLGIFTIIIFTLIFIYFIFHYAYIGWNHSTKIIALDKRIISAKEQRNDFFNILKKETIVIFWGPPRRGKTALLASIANLPPSEFAGNKYTSFPSNSIHAKPFNINSLDLYSDLHLLPDESIIEIDEFNQVGDFTNPNSDEFKKRMEGFLAYIPYLGHKGQHLFIANQRVGGGVWNAIRDIAGLFVYCNSFEKLDDEHFIVSVTTSLTEDMKNDPRSWSILLYKYELDSYNTKWMNPILNAKNQHLDFAEKVGAKNLVQYVAKLKILAESSYLDTVKVDKIIKDCEDELKVALKPTLQDNKENKEISPNVSYNRSFNYRFPPKDSNK